MAEQREEFILDGLECANCAAKMEDGIKRIDGVCDASVNFATRRLSIDVDDGHDKGHVIKLAQNIVNDIEPQVNMRSLNDAEEGNDEEGEEDISLYRLIMAGIVYAAAFLVPDITWLKFLLFGTAYIISGGDVLFRAVMNIFKGMVFDESLLMSIATLGAFAIGQFAEGVAVMLFYQLGMYFENRAVDRSRRSIKQLIDIRPDYANLKVKDKVSKVDARSVSIGDTIVVKPGERIPLDGTISQGDSMVDTSALTGESVPRTVKTGDEVLAGFINTFGLLEIEVNKPFDQSALSRVLKMVEEAGSRKAPTEKFITRFARYYTPVVVFAALAIAVIPPLLIPQAVFADWVYRALVFLVVSCPCALVLSIPLGFFGGIGAASRRGILIKGGNYLEALNHVGAVVFDKTGTLTKGTFKVTKIEPADGMDRDELLRIAAAAESHSNHPIAKSIIEAYGRPLEGLDIKAYEEIAGQGVRVVLGDREILAGNVALMDRYGVKHPMIDEAGTIVYVAVNGRYAGYIIIADEIKDDAAETIRKLKNMGIKTVMLTGDREPIAKAVAHRLGLDGYFAELLPDQKVEKLEQLQKDLAVGQKLAFVGDGINDAPVLARADIGVAMGALGSDAAIEAADVVLMNDYVSRILGAIDTARRTQRIVQQNIILALGVKAAVLILAAAGMASMWAAVFADVGVAILAVLNSIRVGR
ncbi:heavy metal translocating P-type ATPase [Mahella australiensis]|uniref:Heavy metal translocating P-type ATPase n=1 Tax=Mahella australiensis (strain DSM 15567 / CIP 107919 / 50-1 BON) TaxID=697281 RepID=F4A1S2_MAHA5|nr:heavy metal translocating P-type ATPase [Mahella australiensis]AEE97122.1 heavy metal translocating P-type ATPase [Mahella australiensis 50-1 BON]